MSRPRPWATWLVRLATDLLPPGPVRDRYRAELMAELWGLGPAAQVRAGLSMLWAAPSLHRALVESGALDVPHVPLWCRVRLHHRWRRATTEDGQVFRRCRDCGIDNDGTLLTSGAAVEGMMLRGPSQ